MQYGYFGLSKHKVFISFYHFDDQTYKNYLDLNLCQNVINKSVVNGEYNPDNSDEYIKRLIREDKISDSSVVIVLVGQNTKHRKHVDWEMYAGLRDSVNGCSGLAGIMLPEVKPAPDGGYYYADMPARLADNVKSGFAEIYNWSYAVKHFDEIVETAFKNRKSKHDLKNNSRQQMYRNTN